MGYSDHKFTEIKLCQLANEKQEFHLKQVSPPFPLIDKWDKKIFKHSGILFIKFSISRSWNFTKWTIENGTS